MDCPTHITLDLFDIQNFSVLTDKLLLTGYINLICTALELSRVGSPNFTAFPLENGIPTYTVSQALQESLMSLHCYPESKGIYIDLFSCKSFDRDIFYKLSCDYFNPTIKFLNSVIRPTKKNVERIQNSNK
jgi:S-adenosylmethionine/arginine decarboxylase-like enzyme